MKYRKLGDSGLLVSELALGTMTFGGGSGWDHLGSLGLPEVKALISTALEAGVNLLDTADYYALGASEQLLGTALRELAVSRDSVVIATKARLRMGIGVNQVGSSRHHLFNAVDRSLARLKLDHIDLFQLHAMDSITPIEETLEALDDLTRSGKIRYAGFCNFPAWYAAKAQMIARSSNLHRFISMQIYYNPSLRDAENELIPMAQDLGLGTLVWSPLAGGLLSGKYENGEAGRRSAFPFPPVDDNVYGKVLAALGTCASSHDTSIASVALAWLRSRTGITSIIIGARTVKQLESNLAAAELCLTNDDLSLIDKAGTPYCPFPKWMVERQSADRLPGSPTGLIPLKAESR